MQYDQCLRIHAASVSNVGNRMYLFVGDYCWFMRQRLKRCAAAPKISSNSHYSLLHWTTNAIRMKSVLIIMNHICKYKYIPLNSACVRAAHVTYTQTIIQIYATIPSNFWISNRSHRLYTLMSKRTHPLPQTKFMLHAYMRISDCSELYWPIREATTHKPMCFSKLDVGCRLHWLICC